MTKAQHGFGSHNQSASQTTSSRAIFRLLLAGTQYCHVLRLDKFLLVIVPCSTCNWEVACASAVLASVKWWIEVSDTQIQMPRKINTNVTAYVIFYFMRLSVVVN